MAGPSRPFDPGRQAIRPDLADVAEAEHHFAPHYAEAVIWQIMRDVPLREQAGGDATRGTLHSGEQFALLDLTGGWAWGYRVSDHLVGYVEASALVPAE
ncbi:MAG: SH3 domain-containing protein [Sphingopyxis sp.]|nr:SH3 domain-containing protein [Sphingopyxis sp.]